MLKNVHPATFQLISCRSVSDAEIYCASLKDIKPLRKKNIKLKFISLFNSNKCTSQFVGAPYLLLICIESMFKISDSTIFKYSKINWLKKPRRCFYIIYFDLRLCSL